MKSEEEIDSDLKFRRGFRKKNKLEEKKEEERKNKKGKKGKYKGRKKQLSGETEMNETYCYFMAGNSRHGFNGKIFPIF